MHDKGAFARTSPGTAEPCLRRSASLSNDDDALGMNGATEAACSPRCTSSPTQLPPRKYRTPPLDETVVDGALDYGRGWYRTIIAERLTPLQHAAAARRPAALKELVRGVAWCDRASR
jgi:hypothetical protein